MILVFVLLHLVWWLLSVPGAANGIISFFQWLSNTHSTYTTSSNANVILKVLGKIVLLCIPTRSVWVCCFHSLASRVCCLLLIFSSLKVRMWLAVLSVHVFCWLFFSIFLTLKLFAYCIAHCLNNLQVCFLWKAVFFYSANGIFCYSEDFVFMKWLGFEITSNFLQERSAIFSFPAPVCQKRGRVDVGDSLWCCWVAFSGGQFCGQCRAGTGRDSGSQPLPWLSLCNNLEAL